MNKIFVLLLLLFSFAFAKVDYSEMSTQELIVIMGYVKDENKESFVKELNSRISTMNEKEKSMYESNLEKLNK